MRQVMSASTHCGLTYKNRGTVYEYYQRTASGKAALAYDSTVGGYAADDGLSYINSNTIRLDGGFIVEMAFPLYTKKPRQGLTMGFEVLMTASETPGIEMREYLWNCDKNWLYNNTDCYGNIVLKDKVNIVEFNEPEWVAPSPRAGYVELQAATAYQDEGNVTVNFDSKPSVLCNIVLSDDYPLMALEDLARVIGGSVDGNTLAKDGKSLTFTEGSVQAEDKDGHLALERAPIMQNGRLYVPVSVVETMLCYRMHYNRFSKILEIKSGTVLLRWTATSCTEWVTRYCL